MFIPIKFGSVNNRTTLPPGSYAVVCSMYGVDPRRLRAQIFEYTDSSGRSAFPLAVDLVTFEPDGTMRARDFVWQSSTGWRDSDGACSDDLTTLLPPELLKLKLAKRVELARVEVEAAA